MKKFLLKEKTNRRESDDESVRKKTRIQQKYRKEYNEAYPCLRASAKSQSHAFCVVCSRDISVSHGGLDDCRKHVNTTVHLENVKARSSNKTITNFIKNSDEESNVLKAELFFTSFIVEHNLPLSCSDHAGPLFRKMFPDSKIAAKYGCARTKTAAVVNSLALFTQSQIEDLLKVNPFSISTDGSTDASDVKLYPVVVSYFDKSMGKISTVILSVCESTDNTGEGIFRVLNSEMEKRNIPWSNCISFACDNASTMVGQVKGVLSFLKKKNPNIRLQGCACHLLHLAAQKGCKCLTSIDCEQFLIDIFYYLNKSSKRQNAFNLCQKVFGDAPHKILKYVATRWLSFLQCVDRLLSLWDPIRMFFCESESDVNPKVLKIKRQFENPLTMLYLLFLSSVLPIFTKVNEYLQSDKPEIHMLRSKLNTLFSDLIVRFVTPASLPESGRVLDIKFEKKAFQKDNIDIVIGGKTRSYMKNASLSKEDTQVFYSEVRNFYVRSCQYIKEKFPLEDPFLLHAEIADISKRKMKNFASVEYLSAQFPSVLSSSEIEGLEEEFSHFQFHSLEDVLHERADITWYNISQLEDSSGKKLFPGLSKLIMTTLLVPQSNAATERVFSIVRKNKTEFRPSLSTSTLSSLLVEKMKMISSKKVCHQLTFTEKQLSDAKKATRLYNSSFKSSTVTSGSVSPSAGTFTNASKNMEHDFIRPSNMLEEEDVDGDIKM